MALAKRNARKITLSFLIFIFLFSLLEAKNKAGSIWLLSFENISRPLEVEIKQDLSSLPVRLLSKWEKELWKEKSEDLEKLMRQSEKEIAISELDFSRSNIHRKRAYQTSYLSSKTPFTSSLTKPPDWAPLTFKIKKTHSLEKENFTTGWISFTNLSSTNDNLLILSITIKMKNGVSKTLDLAFLKTDPIREVSLKIRDTLAEDILGYDWIRLSPKLEPADSLLEIEGHTLSPGDPHLLYFPKRKLPVTLIAKREGYQSKSFIVSTPKNLNQIITLKSQPSKIFQVSSNPAGAYLYLDNLWLGETPLQFQAIPSGKILNIQLEGYAPKYFELSKLNEKTFIDLRKNLQENSLKHLKHRRTFFYSSLSAMLLSLIPTALFMNLDINAQRLEEMGNPTNRTLTQGLLWSSVVLNIGSLIWNIVEGILYVQQAERVINP